MLTREEIDRFVEDGFLVVRSVFPPSVAARMVPRIWAELEMNRDDPATWTGPAVMLRKILEGPPVPEILSPRYLACVVLLCGGAWKTTSGAGWWPILFPGFPRQVALYWHLDHNAQRIRVDSPERILCAMEYFTDIEPGGGGTAVRARSHVRIARLLAEAGPEGLTNEACVEATADMPAVEVTAQNGDVLFMHPFTVHASSPNTGDHVRIAANRPFWQREPLNLERDDTNDFTAVERAIVAAIQPARVGRNGR